MIGNQISHYRLTRKLGAGTFGEVYEGVHVHDEELRVAVKLVAPSLVQDARFVDALKRECRQLDRMNHPNIVRFRELVVNDGGVAMVLELLRGQDLHDRLAGGPLPVDTAVPVVEAILEGLGHAHTAGVLHRDIKPGNVYWCDDGRIVILDFGIARAADGTQATKTGHMVGTFDYMAPERMSGSGGTASSDVYAVGLIAWELLAGRAASPDGEVARKLMWHMMEGVGDTAKVAATLPGCPPWFAEVIATLAAKDPAARPGDGAAALALLREKRAGAGPLPAAAPSGRRPPPLTVMGPASVGSVPPVAASVPPVSVPPASMGRSAPPGTVMGPAPVPTSSAPPPTMGRSAPPGTVMGPAPAPSAPPPSAPPVAVVPPPQVTASPVSAPPAAEPPASSASKLPLLVLGAAVLAGGAWWLGRSGDAQDAPTVDAAPTAAAGAPSAPAGLTTTSFGAPGSDWVSPSVGTMKWIPAGSFLMGSPESEAGRDSDETQHRVTLTKGFWMMEHEVTQGEWQAGMGSNPANFTQCGAACPVEQVSWDDAVEFAKRVSARDGVTYALPTEAQWEYAARGNGTGVYAGGNELSALGWYDGNSGRQTHPVCQKARNGYGLCDMSGNVWEWTADWIDTYPASAVTDPRGRALGLSRVFRGGSWDYDPRYARVARRRSNFPADRDDFLGFRLSMTGRGLALDL